MVSFAGLSKNFRAATSSFDLWWLSRKSVVERGAIQHIDELTEFALMLRAKPPAAVLEIGTAQGGVFWLFCRLAAPDATLVSLDLPPEERYGGGKRISIDLQSMKQSSQTIHAVHGNSHEPEAQRRVADLLGGLQLDLLFIDGDHTYDGVSQDYNMYSPLVRPGGAIAFHDISKSSYPECQVDRFWNELATNPSMKPRTFISHFPSGWGGIGVVIKS